MHLPYIPKRFYKDPSATLAYEWDWSRWLTRRSDTIALAEIVPVAGLTINSVGHLNGVVTASISGGTLREKYTVTCKITTTGVGIAGVLVNYRSIVVAIRAM